MMTLTTMGLGDRRLDPDGAIPLAALAHDRWRHDPGTLQLFRYSSNFIFTLLVDGERHFLRSAPERQRSREQVEAEVRLLCWLNGEGIDLAAPLPSRRGELVESVETPAGTFHTVLFPELRGEQRDSDALDEAGFAVWGATLGRLHATMRRFPHLDQMARPTWKDDLALVAQHLPEHDGALRREYAQVASALADIPRNAETFGLIHFDFELDNLIWADGVPGIIDFDDCAFHWYAADISFALRDLFDHGVAVADPRVQSFLSGYTAHHQIDDAMVSYLPLFSRLSRLGGYGRIARSLDLDPDGDYPPWLRDLEGRLADMQRAYLRSLEAGPQEPK